jgi:uncharacterized protein YndB with AHSA1/START domain
MAALVSHIDIARPPDEVFAFATDPSQFSRWQQDVVRVLMDAPPNTVGTRFTTTRRIAGAERTMTQEVTEVQAPRRWAARGVDGPIRPSASITVEPFGGGSHVTISLDFEGHGIGIPLAPMVRRIAAKGAQSSYQRLKELLEHPPAA